MSSRTYRYGGGTGQATRLWPVLLVLVTAVLVPAACVLWFMAAAMRNETLAVRQRLRDVYHEQALAARGRIDVYGSDLAKALEETVGMPPAQAFEQRLL